MLQSGEYIPKSRHMGPSFQDIWGQHKENKLLIENKKRGFLFSPGNNTSRLLLDHTLLQIVDSFSWVSKIH